MKSKVYKPTPIKNAAGDIRNFITKELPQLHDSARDQLVLLKKEEEKKIYCRLRVQ